MTRTGFVLLWLIVCGVRSADCDESAAVPDKLKAQVEWAKGLQATRLSELKERRKQAKPPGIDKKRREIDAEIVAVKSGHFDLPKTKKLEVSELAVGQIGVLGVKALEVVSVMNDEKLVVVPILYRPIGYGGAVRAQDVGRVVQEALLNQAEDVGSPMILMVKSTKDLADGYRFTRTELVEVVGTERYKSDGSVNRTVYVIRPVDLETLKEYLTIGVAPAAPVPAKPAVRTPKDDRLRWSNTSYDSQLRHIKGKNWEEFDNKTGKLRWHLTETSRTEEYVELKLLERDQLYRVYSLRLELLKDGKWGWLSNGKWEIEK